MQTKLLIPFFLFLLLFLSLLYPVYAAYVFTDGFESGSTNAWTAETKSSVGTLVVGTSHVHHGTYALNSTTAHNHGWNDAFVYKTLTGITTAYARAYFYIDTYTGAAETRGLLSLANSGYPELLRVGVTLNSGVIYLYMSACYNATSISAVTSATSVSLDTWFCLEIEIVIAAGTGSAHTWLNGAAVTDLTKTGLTNDHSGEYKASRMELGIDNAQGYSVDLETVFIDCAVFDSSYIGVEATGQNLAFSLSEIPVFPTSIVRAITIFNGLAQIPAFITDMVTGRSLFHGLSGTPIVTATLNVGRELFFALSETPKFITDLTFVLEQVHLNIIVSLSEIPKIIADLGTGKALAYSLPEIPKFIADLTSSMGKTIVADLEIIPKFIADLTLTKELSITLPQIPVFIADLAHAVEVNFVAIILSEVPIITATLVTLLGVATTMNDVVGLAALAFIIALVAFAIALTKRGRQED